MAIRIGWRLSTPGPGTRILSLILAGALCFCNPQNVSQRKEKLREDWRGAEAGGLSFDRFSARPLTGAEAGELVEGLGGRPSEGTASGASFGFVSC